MEVQLSNVALKHTGRLIRICSLPVQTINPESLRYITSKLLLNASATVDCETWDICLKKHNGKFNLNLVNVIKNPEN